MPQVLTYNYEETVSNEGRRLLAILAKSDIRLQKK